MKRTTGLVYRHTQVSGWLLGILGISGAVTSFLFVASGAHVGVIAGLVFVVAIAILLGSLTVEVDNECLRLWFGPGVIRKQIAIDDIASARVVRNRWWYGWGIRRTPDGWLYNVSGLGAVEIVERNGRVTRIGSDEPQHLHRWIASRVGAG